MEEMVRDISKLGWVYFIGLILVAATIGWLLWASREQAMAGQHAKNALCALQENLKDSAAKSRRKSEFTISYVKEHGGVKGEAIRGIPNSVLLQGAKDDVATAKRQEKTARILYSEAGCRE